LDEISVVRNFRTTATDGKVYDTTSIDYNPKDPSFCCRSQSNIYNYKNNKLRGLLKIAY